ncbi:Protein of unknown function [Bacillus cereus]
MVDGR